MAVSTNKGYELIATGAENNNWGNVLNASVFNYLDANLGGALFKSLASSNVTLTATEARNAIIVLSGVLSANVQVTSACVGFYFVDNQCTGNFTVTITNGVAGVVVPKGRSALIATVTQGVKVAATATFPTGTAMTFYQTAAPTGWTKSVAVDDAAIRIVSGTAGTTGGSLAFSSAFTSRFLIQSEIPNYTVNSSIGGDHQHAYESPQTATSVDGAGVTSVWSAARSAAVTGVGGSHFHNIQINGGISQTAMNFNVLYANMIIATKD